MGKVTIYKADQPPVEKEYKESFVPEIPSDLDRPDAIQEDIHSPKIKALEEALERFDAHVASCFADIKELLVAADLENARQQLEINDLREKQLSVEQVDERISRLGKLVEMALSKELAEVDRKLSDLSIATKVVEHTVERVEIKEDSNLLKEIEELKKQQKLAMVVGAAGIIMLAIAVML